MSRIKTRKFVKFFVSMLIVGLVLLLMPVGSIFAAAYNNTLDWDNPTEEDYDSEDCEGWKKYEGET
jgi:hypothetical protein